MRSPRTFATSLFTGCAVVSALLVLPTSAAATAPRCSTVTVPVTAVPLLPLTVLGQLCLPGDSRPSTVQLLLHGATYNRSYWDLPYRPERYSYQRDMAAHGLATFAVDELGVGGSSRPLSVLLTGAAQAEAVHQVVDHLRAGHVDGTPYAKVVLVGHSAGSAISVVEAATYHDVDGVVLTGATHLPNVPVVLGDVGLGLQPVTLDPQFAPRGGGDPGYVTTRPDTRGHMYYGLTTLDPLAVRADEVHAKDQVSATSLMDIITLGLVSPLSRGIDVPVLLADGTDDTGFCGLRDCSTAAALRAGEAPYFSPAAALSVYVLPGSGHSVALAMNAPDYRDATRAWLDQYIG